MVGGRDATKDVVDLRLREGTKAAVERVWWSSWGVVAAGGVAGCHVAISVNKAGSFAHPCPNVGAVSGLNFFNTVEVLKKFKPETAT